MPDPIPPGRVKLGGRLDEIKPSEQAYFEMLPHQLVSAARLAAENTVPVRVGSTSTEVQGLSVNRRERVQGVEGTVGSLNTILGWNPDGPIDRDAGVIRVDREDGSPLAVVVSFGCHPVVVGPEDPAINPDFPGPLREAVEEATGAMCVFSCRAREETSFRCRRSCPRPAPRRRSARSWRPRLSMPWATSRLLRPGSSDSPMAR